MKTQLSKILHPLLVISVIIVAFMIVSDKGDALTYDEAMGLDWGGYDILEVERILSEDITEPSVLSEEQKEACLIGDMRCFYKDFDKVSGGIKYEALTAISALETGHFKSELAKEYNNVGGMRGSNGYFQYDTKQDGIEALSNLLTNHYLNPEGCYYEGNTILDVSKNYNQSTHWVQLYVKIRLDMERRIENVPGRTEESVDTYEQRNDLFIRGLCESCENYDFCMGEIDNKFTRFFICFDPKFSQFITLPACTKEIQENMLVSGAW